ncbi:MAG: metal ABC transporter substrate-binding protein, partial [Caldilineaceae bacterium]|nr:metal ABC transporter substrate-binding protein [Caldilineaceae bacterium]
MLHSLRILSSILTLMFLLAACTPVAPGTTSASADAPQASTSGTTASEETDTPSGPPVRVVTTTNFVADWARVVGGSRVEVFSLLPVGGDPHTFLPGARDVAQVADADVVFTVGLGLEGEWLHELVHNASADESKIVALGESVDPIEFTMVDMH